MVITGSTCSSSMTNSLNSHIEIAAMVLNDGNFNQWLTEALNTKSVIVLANANHLCKVYDQKIADAPLLLVNPDKESAKILKRLAKAGLLKQVELAIDELSRLLLSTLAGK